MYATDGSIDNYNNAVFEIWDSISKTRQNRKIIRNNQEVCSNPTNKNEISFKNISKLTIKCSSNEKSETKNLL